VRKLPLRTVPSQRFRNGQNMSSVPRKSTGPYQVEVFMQCYAAMLAWNAAHDKLRTPLPADPGQQLAVAMRVMGDLQSFLVAAGILSDLFFPDPKKGDVARGQSLCAVYGVTPDSPLSNKKVRNSFVHVDERLDKWLPTQAGEGKAVGPFSIVHWDGPPPTSEQSTHLRILDSKNWRIMVRGEPLELFPLLKEIDRVGRRFPLTINTPQGPIALAFEPARYV
jgi:hypothetical protein